MATIKKILVPFDDNLRSIAALEYAAMFADGIGANITALHLADPKDFHSLKEFRNDLDELVNDELRPKLKEIQSRFPSIQKFDLQIRGLQKPIHQHIIDFANENAPIKPKGIRPIARKATSIFVQSLILCLFRTIFLPQISFMTYHIWKNPMKP